MAKVSAHRRSAHRRPASAPPLPASGRPRRHLGAYLAGAVGLLVVGLVAVSTLTWNGGFGQAAPAQEVGGQAAPDFAIRTLAGERFRLAEQRGKVVGVLFLASWCLPCIAETQAWGRLQREYGTRGLEVLLVSADPQDTPADLERFRQMARSGPDRHWAIDADQRALVLPFQVRSLDTTLIFDRQGTLAYRDGVPTPYDVLKRELEKVL